MKMIPVKSEAMNSIGYDPQTRRMLIEFKQGKTYPFCNVPQRVFDGLKNAHGRHGEYYHEHIKDRYPC